MNILVICWRPRRSIVQTHDNHLYSFRRYGDGDHFYYYNCSALYGLPMWLTRIPFDAVLFHYTFLAYRFDQNLFWDFYEKNKAVLQGLKGVKAMMPHDEYCFTRSLWVMIRDCTVERVYSSCFYHDHDVIFPFSETGRKNLCHPVFTGYIDPKTEKWVKKREKRFPQKTMDIGYRAGNANFAFGLHGQLKKNLADAFHECLPRHPGLKEDVKLTYLDSYKNTLTGKAWYDFLLKCRSALGCLGGSSILDPDGKLRQAAWAYIKKNPNATGQEVVDACYQGQEGKIQTKILGPRVFEYAMTHTCQLMVEGDYFGVIEPYQHYIPIKEDFSNLDEVLDLVENNPEYCKKIADQCYEHVVASGKYSYKIFVKEITDDLRFLTENQDAAERDKSTANIFWRFYFLLFVDKTCMGIRMLAAKGLSLLRKTYHFLRKAIAVTAKTIAPGPYQKLRDYYRKKFK